MSKMARVCVAEQTLHWPAFILEPSLKHDHGIKDTQG
jgi:hypothetical protein